MVTPRVAKSVTIRKLQVISIDDLNLRIRILLTDPSGARHGATVSFVRVGPDLWDWSVERAGDVQLPLGVRS